MIGVERHGGVDALTVGILSCLSSGSTIGREWAVRLVTSGGLFGWFASWRVCRRAGGFPGRLLVGRLGGGTHGLEFLATIVTSSSLSLARIWNGLLLRVWHWWTNGICWMTLGAVIFFDVVATLGGGACSTL